MTIISWIQGHQLLVGGSIIGVLCLGTGAVVFFFIRKSGKKIVDLPGKIRTSLIKNIKKDKEVEIKVSGETRQGMSASVLQIGEEVKKKMALKKLKNMVDLDSLSAEQLEQFVKEKRVAEAAAGKREQLMAMSKEELVEIIIDNQVEI